MRTLVLFMFTLFLIINVRYACDTDADCGSDVHYEVCNSKNECVSCLYDSDCSSRDECKSDGFCELKPLSKTFDYKIVLTIFSILIGSSLASAGGLGGGGIFVPIFVLIIGLTPKSSSALSQATIFGGQCINVYLQFRQKHPLAKHRPLPDLTTILILEPMLLGGTIVGVLLNQIFPDYIILTLLIITLVYTTRRAYIKGTALWRKETLLQIKSIEQSNGKERKVNLDTDNINVEKPASLLQLSNHNNEENFSHEKKGVNLNVNQNDDNNNSSNSNGNNNKDDNKNDKVDNEIEDKTTDIDDELGVYIGAESSIKKPIALLLIVWIIVSIFSILRSSESIAGIKVCSSSYWLVTFLIHPLLLLVTIIIANEQLRVYKYKIYIGWKPYEGDIEWTRDKIIKYPMYAGFAGIFGGLLGIGGGMIVSPLLLELGMLPSVAAATSSLAVLITSSSATLQFLLINMLKLDYMFLFMNISIIGTLIGYNIISYFVQKHNRQSIIIFSVALVIGLATILMTLDGILNIVNENSSNSFTSIC